MLKNILCAATLLAASSITLAAPITYSLGPVATDSGTYNINAVKFDDAGGTLQLDSVMISFSTSVTTEVSVTNNISTDFPNVNIFVNGMAGLSFAGESVSVAPSIFESLGVVAGNTTVSSGPFTESDSIGPTNYLSPAVLAYFQGTGTADFAFSPTALSGSNSSGNATIKYVTTANADITIEYISSLIPTVPVSAPTHLALLGVGLLGFWSFRKNRK